MPLIRDGAFVADDFVHVADGEALPAGPIVVSLARFLAERATLLQRDSGVGVRLEPSEGPEALGSDVNRLARVEIMFPKFRDGRGYTTARLLRARLGYTGEIRAVGDVLRDQWLFMARCGIDAFEVRPGTRLEDFRVAMAEQTVFYQRAADGAESIFARRQARLAPQVMAAE
jgi:uncharacterized protein (DUF934 family)